jgi:hypothetical protein
MDISVSAVQMPGAAAARVRLLTQSKEGTLQVAVLLTPQEARAIAKAMADAADNAERAILLTKTMPSKSGLIT